MVTFHVPRTLGAQCTEERVSFSVPDGAVLFAGSRGGVVPAPAASLLVAGLSRLGFSFLVGCAPGVDERFRYTLSLSGVTDEHTFVACAFEKRAAEIGRTGLFASLVVPEGVSPRAALRRRTLWLVKRADLLVLFPDDPETGYWGRGSALAFRAALDQLKPAFVVTTRPPALSLSYHLLPDRFFGFLDGWWVVPHPVAQGTCDEEM